MTLTYGRAWTTYDVTSHGDGSASVHMQTTTVLPDGAPARREGATLEFDSLDQALVLTGTSRISASGVVVTVRLDGEELMGRG
jgi:hypothetical protein